MCVKCITGKEKEKSRNMSNKREKSISQEAGATAAAVVGTVRGTELEWISKSMKMGRYMTMHIGGRGTLHNWK